MTGDSMWPVPRQLRSNHRAGLGLTILLTLDRISVPPNFAERLKHETRSLHRQAEQTRFMRLLIGGGMGAPAYCRLLRNLLALYCTLEPAILRQAKHPLLAPVVGIGLFRSAALRADLRALRCDEETAVRSLEPLAAATQAYVQRLRGFGQSGPERLLAHAYVRYMGDLNGGQRLASIVANALQLPHGEGTAFYEFGGAARTAALSGAFRQLLESGAADPEIADTIIAEAQWSFAQHITMFDELAFQTDPAA